MAALSVAALAKSHDLASFDCGNDELNRWLKTTARQHQRTGISKTFVLIDDAEPAIILGFATIAIRAVTPVEDLPSDLRKRLPATVPGFTLARLGISIHAQKRGYGEYLLFEAMERAYHASRLVGGFALFVDAKQGAADFYRKYGFQSLPNNPDVLVLPMASMPEFPDPRSGN